MIMIETEQFQEQRMEIEKPKEIQYSCKKHGLIVKYFCIEVTAMESLLCESCYKEKQQNKNIKVLLFEMIYDEIINEIQAIPLDYLQSKCIDFNEQIKKSQQDDNLLIQNPEVILKLTQSLEKIFEVLNRLFQMKEKINDKIWSSYFVKAIQNKSAINQVNEQLTEVEQNIDLIKKGYFSYRRGFVVSSAFLLQNNSLFIQDSTGNIYIYDSTNLTKIYEPKTNSSMLKFSKAVQAFQIDNKKIGVIYENATLIIYKITLNNKLEIFKKLFIRIVPTSITISKNFIRLEYNLFQVIINKKTFKILESSNKWGNLVPLDQQNFFEWYPHLACMKAKKECRNVFIEKFNLTEFQLHTETKCLTCQMWVCQSLNKKKNILKYRNSENQIIRVYRYGVRI